MQQREGSCSSFLKQKNGRRRKMYSTVKRQNQSKDSHSPACQVEQARQQSRTCTWTPRNGGQSLDCRACRVLSNLLRVQKGLEGLLQVKGHAAQCPILRASHSYSIWSLRHTSFWEAQHMALSYCAKDMHAATVPVQMQFTAVETRKPPLHSHPRHLSQPRGDPRPAALDDLWLL